MVGGKWKLLILGNLLKGSCRFGELKRKIPDINERVLARQLRELETHELITRTVFPEVPPRVEYTMTEECRSLIPALYQLAVWGAEYQSSRGVVREYDENSLEYLLASIEAPRASCAS